MSECKCKDNCVANLEVRAAVNVYVGSSPSFGVVVMLSTLAAVDSVDSIARWHSDSCFLS